MASLGIIYAHLVKRNEGIFIHDSFGRSLEALSQHFDHIRLFGACVTKFEYPTEYRVAFENVGITVLPAFRGWRGALLNRRKIRRAYKAIDWSGLDVMLIRYPMPFGYVLARAARHAGVTVVWHVVGNPRACLRETKSKGFIARRLGAALLALEEWRTRREMRNTLVFTSGREMAANLAGVSGITVVPVQDSILKESDFFWREDTCQGNKIKIITVSYFDPVKAIDLTCEAVRMLVDKGYDIVFDLVGDGPGRKLVEAAVDRLGLCDRVFFHGFVPQGELMTEYFRNADIFVLSSNSEGSPRTLNEAMARCVPVIATDVGGVSDILKRGELGLLVPPKDSGSIADAIEKLITDGKLRRRFIRSGYEDTKKHTLELFTKETVEHMLRHHANAKRTAK